MIVKHAEWPARTAHEALADYYAFNGWLQHPRATDGVIQEDEYAPLAAYVRSLARDHPPEGGGS